MFAYLKVMIETIIKEQISLCPLEMVLIKKQNSLGDVHKNVQDFQIMLKDFQTQIFLKHSILWRWPKKRLSQ